MSAPDSIAPPPVAEQLRSAVEAIRGLKAEVARLRRRVAEPIAIVGASCRIPGGADTPDEYWAFLETGRDAVREVPPERWDLADVYDADPARPGKTYARHAALLDDVAGFDADFFGISPREAEAMDPQHRLLMELCWEALERAAIDPRSLKGSSASVFLGLSSSDYSLPLLADRAGIDAYVGSGNAHGAAAGRISYLLGLHGPAIAVDTACSSSLTAVHLACQSLRAGECDLALAGGVNVLLAPELTINFSKARMLSPSGRCRTFDASADGFVRGEGGGIVACRRLSDAIERQETILAVIAGSAVNHDGSTSGLTVPSGPAQERLIREALTNAGLEPSAIGYVEAHGTGTALGDPIEMNALARVFAGRSTQLYVGSVKTNIGHLEAGAGIAGLIKAALCVARGRIPASLHWTEMNPHIELGETPVSVAATPCDWPANERARAAGVSAFGFGGTNVHVVVTAPPPSPVGEADPDPLARLFVLSAHTPSALREAARRAAAHLAGAEPDAAALADLSYSAQTGRALFAHRLAVLAPDGHAMAGALAAFAQGGLAPEGTRFWSGTAQGSVTPPDAADLATLAETWVAGAAVDWPALWKDRPPRRRMPFPTYPFERERHWAKAAERRVAPREAAEAAPSQAQAGGSPANSAEETMAALAGLPRAEALRWLTDHVRREVARVLRYLPPRLPDADAGLFELGFDSIMTLDLSLTFEENFGFSLPETTAIDHPTPAAIARYLLGLIGPGDGGRPPAPAEAAASAAAIAPGTQAQAAVAAERLAQLIRKIRAERLAGAAAGER